MDAASPNATANSCAGDASGLLLIADNQDALAIRALLAREAVSTLDLMYYIWRDDDCGRLLLSEVVAAAERGVRVRMLIDDINPQSSDATYLALDSHPNIELRLFNPSGMRNGSVLRKIELVSRVLSMTRRMHGKAWIADRNVAVLGGRNIGNEYFDEADTNFRDLDLLMFGIAVEQTCEIFEAYWNHEATRPIKLLNSGARPPPPSIATQRKAALETTLGRYRSTSEFVASNDGLLWDGTARVVADPPDKVFGGSRGNWLFHEILPLVRSSEHRLEIVSPYFIPGTEGVDLLSRLVQDGVEVTVITNSLAATDVAAVHGAYSRYRKKLLHYGVALFEFRPFEERARMTVFGSKGASLHTKAFTVDGKIGFIGSFNFDPRSASLNAEMGVIFEDERLVAKLHRCIERDQSPQASFRLSLNGRKLSWECAGKNGVERFDTEPHASLSRRLIAALVRWLPIELQL